MNSTMDQACIPSWNMTRNQNNTSFNGYSTSLPFINDLGNISNDIANEFIIDEGESSHCYERMGPDQMVDFYAFERNLGGYAICAVGVLGIIGNCINLGVLSHKEMRGNCFNQLLIGEFFAA